MQWSQKHLQCRAVMIHHDSAFFQEAWQPVLEQGVCSVWMSFVLVLGHLWSSLIPDYLLPQLPI